MAAPSKESTEQGHPPAPNLTPEQDAIIASTGNIRINAVAGSGKTTTIIQYAASRPRTVRILYLAFNRSVRLEAKKRFAAQGLHNVQVETAHSLAYKYIVPARGYKVCQKEYKTYEIAELLGLASTGEKHGEYILANHISKFMAYFCNSAAQKVQDLDYTAILTDDKAKAFARNFQSHIVHGTRLLLSKMHKGQIDVTHDFYLKMFQLSKPVLPYDYILFDEAQDASPAMLDIFLRQSATKVIVGDSHQQIYSWRHAINSLEKADFKNYYLSTSFRFPQDIASLSMEILSWKKHLQEYQPVSITGKGKPPTTKGKATIARTNLGLLLRAITFITDHKEVKHIYFEGNINAYTYADEGASLYDVLNLYNGRHDRIRDKLVSSMNTLDELEDYIEKTEDVQLGMMVEIVKEYENEIPSLIQSLKARHVGDEEKEKAEMIFSTVHRAKGMEYDAVQLVEDFITETKLEKLKEEKGEELQKNLAKWNEEINLLYVAATRTKGLLRIPETLLPKNFPPSPHIQVIKVKKDEDVKTVFSTDLPFSGIPATRKRGAAERPGKKTAGNLGKESALSYAEKRLRYKNAYQPWTDEADATLKEMYYKGTQLTDIADHFGRNKGVILSRLRKLGCVDFE